MRLNSVPDDQLLALTARGDNMTFGRMQLHPNEAGEAIAHSVSSLGAGYIGLDFSVDVGDLMRTTQSALPDHQKDYWAFAHEMAVNDKVLIIAHHFPFAREPT